MTEETAATQVRNRDQKKLPGVVPEHMVRLEEIEDEMEEIDAKISKLKEKKNELNSDAVELWKDHRLEPHIRGSNEWYLDEPVAKIKRRRHKITKEKTERKRRKATA
ncbi:MAG: hypothetical protein ACRD1X_12470 [Vicinamibacteria bacterium]